MLDNLFSSLFITDHKNLMRDALGLTLDQVYQWRLLLEEYGPKIVYIKDKHNTVADAICNLMAWVSPQCQLNSWELLYDKSQELKMQSETKLDCSLKTLV